MKNGGHGVKVILFRAVALFVIVMLALLWLCQTVFLDEFYRTVKTGEIKKAASSAVKLLNSEGITEDGIEEIAERYGTCVEILLIKGNTARRLVSVEVLGRCAVHAPGSDVFSFYRKVTENNGVYLEYLIFDPQTRAYEEVGSGGFSGDDELSIIYAVTEKMTDGDLLMIFDSSVTPISATVNTLYILLAVFSVLILVLSALLSLVLSKKIAAPIEKLTEAAENFGRGDGADFSADGYYEVDRLSEALTNASAETVKTEALRRDILANVSHDLRTPITLIKGYAEMMRDIPEENTQENLENIISESERLSLLVSDVLEYSRLISGTTGFDMRVYDISEQVSEITARYSEMLKKDGITLRNVPFEKTLVRGDRAQLGRVLVNYISNAASHIKKDGTITVFCELSEGWLTVHVSDDGEGIPADKLADIWERYEKVSSNGRRSDTGSGLGLSIVKAIMKRSGGAYGVRSKLGSGSDFWFALKTCDEEKTT